MTELLYHEDAYLKEFEAEVMRVSSEGAVLDRTAFFPGGGGQPEDQGVLRWNDETIKVTKMRRKDGLIWHLMENVPFGEGATLFGEIDWDRRYKLMRTHTAMHILCGVIWRDYGASVTGGNMEPLHARMDFEFKTMKRELVDEIEMKINLEVKAARVIRTKILPREEAFQIPDLIRTKINLLPKGIENVRVVEIVGLDYKSKGAINKRIVVSLAS
jgi:misacylated tRNA(Ala) deacylase